MPAGAADSYSSAFCIAVVAADHLAASPSSHVGRDDYDTSGRYDVQELPSIANHWPRVIESLGHAERAALPKFKGLRLRPIAHQLHPIYAPEHALRHENPQFV